MLSTDSTFSSHFISSGDAENGDSDAATSLPAAGSARSRQAWTAGRHRQDYIKQHIDAALLQGLAPGLTLLGQNMEQREVYVAGRLSDGGAQGNFIRAAGEWDTLAAGHVAALVGAAFDQHRTTFLQRYVECVLQCGIAPGLVLAGRNVENRLLYLAALEQDADTKIAAQTFWNRLASEHTQLVAGTIYVRQHPLPTVAALRTGKPWQMPVLTMGSDASLQFHMGQSAQILMQISQASGPLLPEAPAYLEPLGPGGATPALSGYAMQLEIPDPAGEYSDENYARLQACHRKLSAVFLEEFMRSAPNTLLFKIYIDPDMQDNPYDLQDMASKILFERRH